MTISTRLPEPDGLNDTNLDMPPAASTIASRPRRTTLIDLIGNPSDPEWNGKVVPIPRRSQCQLYLYDDDGGGHYHCFVCDAHGTAIDYLMMVEGLDRNAALEMLAQERGDPADPRRDEISRTPQNGSGR
jgi:hypothetical protein